LSGNGAKAVGALVACGLGVALLGSAMGLIGGPDDRHAVVVRVVDGDTLIADIDGDETMIRLLNIDTPETKDPNLPVQCLGPEASDFLAERLPEGTEIELEYDEEREDRYGRTLAGVFESDSLINAEIAAAGLGVPVLFEPNDRFLADVERAAEDAEAEELGLYSAEISCSLPAQVEQMAQTLEAIPASVEGDPAAAVEEAENAYSVIDDFARSLTDTDLTGLGNRVIASSTNTRFLESLIDDVDWTRDRAVSRRDDLVDEKASYDEEQERLEAERQEKEREEREQREQEEREREEREREEAERRTEEPADSGAESTSSGHSSSSENAEKSSSGADPSSGGSRDSKTTSGSSSTKEKKSSSSSGCEPYGPEIPYSDDGGYSGKRYGMPGGKTFRKCR